ncbi:asparagine synthase (glutamine-hydrolyzing) [Halarcobacter ebronensis]|uniref:asparagine synthase (glutamine-hydrolyzing) n=1 Tax=Halarcobacter ebronensis TaxID=1462615 RepID=A0A4Q1AMB4_9BACT|nr:asparagine synthase (glutamine-hydrolyzing) [Halarcobacter ebronensis]QKF81090.1 asparagine synthase (glutamine-hydrolyzing) [Halarcobacter ebronensis]RXK06395.1 asparagine synthase (glutamine-hydrolyzing) [Halarcobacter ebronensis]
MCGIIGFSSLRNNSQEILKNILDGIRHRGPDNKSFKFYNKVGLGHVRLSIIDLHQESNQPMSSFDKRYTIIYNGEIYNYKEIKHELELLGYNFITNGDTEVILNGFIEFKEKIVEKLSGMFAFSIYDNIENIFFLARDRYGIKPLFFYNENEDFWFCSEVKPLEKYISDEKSLESSVLFLLLGSLPPKITINKYIQKFPSGHYAWYKKNNLILEQYYNIEYQPKIKDSYKNIIANIHDLTTNAVKNNLVSDTPVGTFLSGGLDSSIITAIASRYVTKLKTVSVSFEDKIFSEDYYQKLVVDKFKTEHYDYHITKEIFQLEFLQYLEILDQPNMDGFNTYLASKMARKAGLKSILAGQGADEIFYSYDTFLNAKKLRENKSPLYGIFLLRKFKELIRSKKIPKDISLYLKNIDLSLYLPGKQIFTPSQIANILNLKIEKVLLIILNCFMKFDSSNILAYDDKVSYYEVKLYLENQLLAKDDMSSMANSLEIRIPFLDTNLVDYVTKIEPSIKYDKKVSKVLLAKAFEKELPSEIIYRDKKGFSIPYGEWLETIVNDIGFNENIYINLFLNKKIGWTKFITLVMLKKFNSNIELSGEI